MTKVLVRWMSINAWFRRGWFRWAWFRSGWRWAGWAWVVCLLSATAFAATLADCPQTTAGLYARLRSVPLHPQRVYRIRDASIDRPNLHLDFDDGILAFTEDICGRITGAFFEGEAELRLRPPNREERGSLALFTGMAILEEQITSAYLRFNDDTAAVLRPFLSSASDKTSIIKEQNETARLLAEFDALRLLLDFSHFLPVTRKERTGSVQPAETLSMPARIDPPLGTTGSPFAENAPPRKFASASLLHAHLLGKKHGAFEVVFDEAASEPLWVGQPRTKDGTLFFDIWTSFAPTARTIIPSQVDDATITSFRIEASVQPPTMLRATTEITVEVRSGGERMLLFELSRYLKVDAVETGGQPTDFLQNPAIEGSHLQRKGNDLVAVVFPAPLAPGQKLKLRFSYAGEVLSEAGNGLLYVGERGTWYPNLGLSPAQFDIEFRYPSAWTLVATGKQSSHSGGEGAVASSDGGPEKVSRWISERPIPVAGFNLGKYVRAEAKAGNIRVEAYGTRVVEKTFPKSSPVVDKPIFPIGSGGRARTLEPSAVPPAPPSPARDAQAVADKAAKAVANFSQWFGPYPYGSLALTQMPGNLSQGWPGLVFLSSFAFLNPQEQADLHLDAVTRALASQVLVHETAHQWWGDLILWKSYRDQWIVEGLANYSSLLMLEKQDPAQFREVLEKYRRDLLSENKDGERLRDAGPVTLGQRLDSSHFPNGYEEISYERGTWLFHMLRCMLRDSALHDSMSQNPAANSPTVRVRKGHYNSAANAEEPFFRVLRKIRERYAGKSITTEQLIQAFEENLPRPLWYEKRSKLDWFLEGWIEGTAIPRLETKEIHSVDKAGLTSVSGVIVQKDAPDDLVTAIPIYAATPANTLVFLGEVLADGHETPFRLTAPANTRKILLDPNQTILSAPK